MNIPTQASDDISRLAGQFNIYSQLLRNRIVMLWDQVDDEIAKEITAQLLYLEGEDQKRIFGYISLSGGSVTAGMAIYDTMQLIKPDVSALCLGLGASMGQFLLGAGAQGKRYSQTCPHNDASTTRRYSRSSIRHRNPSRTTLYQKLMAELIAGHTGQTVEQVQADSDRTVGSLLKKPKNTELLTT